VFQVLGKTNQNNLLVGGTGDLGGLVAKKFAQIYPETNSKFAPENRPQTFQKERTIFQTNLFSAVFAVSFREGIPFSTLPTLCWLCHERALRHF